MKSYKTILIAPIFLGLVSISSCAPTKTQEGTGQYIDDTVITAKTKAALLKEPSLKSVEINVETYKRVVQLSGFISSQTNINKAISITQQVAGVVSVKNDMQLKKQIIK